jgi:hypothetical protein
MDLIKANQIVNELIELSTTKHGFLKVGHDTLNIDILFIKKFEDLKVTLDTQDLDSINITQLPRIKELKELIVLISEIDNKRQQRNVRMTKASKAYQKK